MSKLDELLGRDELRGFQSVRVAKEKLLDTIKKNRDDHRKIFEEALEGWKKKVTADLEEAVEMARAGRDYKIHLNLPRPQDHTDDYDTVIVMLELSLDDEFELDRQEVENYLMDRWHWQRGFLENASSYGSSTAGGKFAAMNMRE